MSSIRDLISDHDVALIRASGYFDEAWYVERYQDVKMLGMDPVEHYLWLGSRIGRSPSRNFSSPGYLSAHRDVRAAGIDPLVHYLQNGIAEGRTIYPVRDGSSSEKKLKCRRILVRRSENWDWARHEQTVQMLNELPLSRNEEKVSVIMPTYNRADMIAAAISSVLEQTHSNLELIVIDDGSTDRTAEILSEFDDPRIVYMRNKRRKGVSGARNTGLDTATGKWAFFLDADNVWDCRMVEFMLKHAAVSQTSAGYCAAKVHDENHETKFILYSDFDFESCLHENFVDLNCFFLRWSGRFREFRFDEDLKRLVDWDLILHVAACTRVVGIPFVGVDYYDGPADRITNMEYVGRGALQDLLKRVRERARPAILKCNTIMDSSAYRVAVHLHVYHPDLVPECLDYLGNIHFDFDLFVTSSLDEEHEVFRLIRAAHPRARIFYYPNAGADIGPFMELISTFKPYRLLLKIHTKRDVDPWGNAWRRGLLDPILGSAGLVDEIVARFQADEQLAMACSSEFYKHGVRNSIPASLDQLHGLARETNLHEHQDKDWAFVAGTMFWVRPQLFLRLATHMCQGEGYSTLFLRDGAIEHGLERALGLALWQQKDNRVALVTMDGEINEVGLGGGCSMEGVSQTMKRLHAR
jgi:glycosyltransferase involved in cell wall biosynthesis